MTRFYHLLGLVLLGVAALGFTGCVSADEHKRLQAAFDQARAQLAESEADLARARARIAELEARIAQLEKGNGALAALMKERDLLAERLAKLEADYKKLLETAGQQPVLPETVNDLLRKLAEQYPDLLEFDERLGMVRFKSDLTFDLGSTEVKPRAKEALARFAAILNNDLIKRNEIVVVGHTDDVPIRLSATNTMNPSNFHLSTNRAHAVLKVLRDAGVNQDRGQAAGWGEQRPIAPNAAGQRGNEKNRRVDIYIKATTVPEGIVVSTPGAARPTTPRAPRTPTTRPAGGGATTPVTPSHPVPVPTN